MSLKTLLSDDVRREKGFTVGAVRSARLWGAPAPCFEFGVLGMRGSPAHCRNSKYLQSLLTGGGH